MYRWNPFTNNLEEKGDWFFGGNILGAKKTLGSIDNQDFGIITNNTERLTVLKGGNVGIGITNPNGNLNIKGAATVPTAQTYNGNFVIDSPSATSIQMGNLPAYPWGGWIQVYNEPATSAGNYSLLLNPLGGNVGIGTTNPADKLQVTGGNVLISNATITTSTPKAAITKEYLDANTWAKYGDGVATKYATDEDILSAVLEPNLNTNKLWFYDTSLFLFEGSNDGINYTPYTVSVTQLEKILANYNPEAVSLSLGGAYKYYRITITGNTNRVALETLQMKMITVSKPINVFLERFRNSSNTWETFVNTTWAGGYPDTMTIKHSSFQLHPTWTGGKGSSKVRITLSFVDGTTNNISINSLRWYGYFSYVDDIANRRSVYTWDYDKNVAFPASIFVAGNIGIGTTAPTAKLDINSDILRLRTAKTPATAGASGNQGDIAWDADYLYICVNTNTWKRSALSTW